MSVRTVVRVVASIALPLVIAGTLGLQPAAAAAPKVACGATLTSNASLTADLKCTGKGLTLGADVRLNLNGYSLTGNGTGTAVTFSPRGGGAVINGRVTNWAGGFSLDTSANDTTEASTPSIVSAVTVSKAPSYVLYGATLNIVDSNFTDSLVYAMYADLNADNSKFTRSSLGGSQTTVNVTRSTIVGGRVSGADGQGVSIANSTLDGTGFDGAPAGCYESGISITDSTVKNYPQRISGAACSVSLVRSNFSNNPGGVLYAAFLQGLGGGATVRNSTFTTSGIAVEGNRTLTVVGSKFTNNVTGILINDLSDGEDGPGVNAVISGNVLLGNSSSGIRSASTYVEIGKNKAANNGRYGIYAPGAVDKGGNVAYGNKLANCVGVVCSAG